MLDLLKKAETEEAYFEIKKDSKSGEDIPYLRFHAFDEIGDVKAYFSTRLGGVSEGIYESMNLSFTRGDDPAAVRENYRRILDAWEVKEEELVFSDQIHKTDLWIVGASDCQGLEGKISETDGLLTDEKDVALVTSFADCVPIFLVDPVKHVIANVHSGWRGTVGLIGSKAVRAMKSRFGCDSENIIAVIGPSICQQCYEVGEDVVSQILSLLQDPAIKDAMEEYAEYNHTVPDVLSSSGYAGKYQLNLWVLNQLVLIASGLSYHNIHVSGVCTCCHSDIFFSHRASQGKRGNLHGLLMLR